MVKRILSLVTILVVIANFSACTGGKKAKSYRDPAMPADDKIEKQVDENVSDEIKNLDKQMWQQLDKFKEKFRSLKRD